MYRHPDLIEVHLLRDGLADVLGPPSGMEVAGPNLLAWSGEHEAVRVELATPTEGGPFILETLGPPPPNIGKAGVDGGVIVEDGPADQVIGAPREARTRTFLQRVLDPSHQTT